MKKDILLKLTALIVILFALKAIVAQPYEIDCETACKAGRWVSKEVCQQCNGCEMYDDQAAQECRDIPY